MAEVGADQAPAVEAVMGEERALVRPRFGRGCRCFAIRLEDGIAGYGWLSRNPEWIGELGLEFTPPPRDAYLWNCVTLPEHRRRGYFRSLLDGVVGAARAEGCGRLWIGSVGGAESAVLNAGFRPVLQAGILTAFGWRWLQIRSVPGASPEAAEDAFRSLGGEALQPGLARFRRRIH